MGAIESVGRTKSGVVYEARQSNPNRTVALKIMKPGLATEDMLRRFDNEAHLLGRLQHPGIAQIFEAGAVEYGDQHIPFFAMERIRGCTLSRVLEQLAGRAPESIEGAEVAAVVLAEAGEQELEAGLRRKFEVEIDVPEIGSTFCVPKRLGPVDALCE